MKVELILDIVGIKSNEFPAIVTATFVDINNRLWILKDKEPVFISSNLYNSYTVPFKTCIEVSVLESQYSRTDLIYTIDTSDPHGLETICGCKTFKVSEEIIDRRA